MEKIKANIKYIIPFIVILTSIKVRKIETISIIKTVFDILPIIYVVLFGVYFIFRKKRVSLLCKFLIVIDILLLINTAIHPLSDNFIACVRYTSSCLSIAFLIEAYKDKYPVLLKSLLFLFEILIYVNLVILIKRIPEGFINGKEYLFGHYNNTVYYLIPPILIAYLSYKVNKQRIRPAILLFVSFVSLYINDSSTGKAAGLAIIAIVIFEYVLYFITKGKVLTNYLFTLGALFLNAFFVFGFSGGKIKVFDFIIEKILHRRTDFTGRTPIWDCALNLFKKSPIIGYGYQGYQIEEFYTQNPHSRILYYLLIGGIVAIILFAVFNIIFSYKIDRQEVKTKIVFNAIIFGTILSTVTEGVKYFFVYFILYFLMYNYKSDNSNNELGS